MKIFPTFRVITKCWEIGKAKRRLSSRLSLALNLGNRESRAMGISTFKFRSKCREISRRLSLRLGSALNVGKYVKRSVDLQFGSALNVRKAS